MPFRPLIHFYPDLALEEMRSFILTDGDFGVPAGNYDLFENYCDEKGCDCRKVMINIITTAGGQPKIWATIGHGWENPSYYFQNFSDDVGLARAMSGSYLEQMCEQSKYSPAFLEIWKDMIKDENYAERLKAHYKKFKEKI